jgi:predicted  nucleic acid-binding Zn-ribbon protein
MESTKYSPRRRAALLVALFVALLGTPASAQDSRYKQQIQQFRSDLEEYSKLDEAGLADKDIAMVRSWLDDAETLVAKGQTETAKLRIKRVEYGLDLIRSMVTASQLRSKAEKQEQAFHQAREDIERLEAEIEALQKRRDELQSELESLQKDE